MSVIAVQLGGDSLRINEKTYKNLFDNSVVHGLTKYEQSIENKSIGFFDFVELARKADVPYTLFFAPKEFVDKNIKRKNDLLLQGVTKKTFSLNSRGTVELRDIELIIKDILRKQELLKTHNSEKDNEVFGCLKRSSLPLSKQADKLRSILGIELKQVKKYTKTKTFEYLAKCLEDRKVFVAQSSRLFMPQIIQRNVKFSGVCVKDKKYPFIFLNNKDDTKSFEPEGRKILTLILLTACLAKGRFNPLSYNDQSQNVIQDNVYQIAEEILMPASEVEQLEINTLQELKRESDKYSVTPSAMLMRLRRLKALDRDDIDDYQTVLKDEFDTAPEPRARTPKPENGFKKYNGIAYSKAVFDLIDRGVLTRRDARRILTQNRYSTSFIEVYRMSI